MFRTLLLVVFVVLVVGCGSRDESAAASSTTPASSAAVNLSVLPVTLEGMLVADVGEGDVDEDGADGEYSEFNFGTLTVGAEEIPIQVSGSVLRSANLAGAEGKVRATLGSKSDEYGHTFYQITSLQRL